MNVVDLAAWRKKKAEPQVRVHIGRVVIVQDLRNMDPDRVMAAFRRALDPRAVD